QAQSAFAPGAGNDQGLDEVALYAVEIRRLMVLVEQSERHQEQPRAQAETVAELPVEVELLDLEFTRVIGGCHGMLHLVLGVEFRAVIEVIADPEHGAREIDLRAARIAGGAVVVHLAITPQSYVAQRGEIAAGLSPREAAGGRGGSLRARAL